MLPESGQIALKPAILYLNTSEGDRIHAATFAGIRRYAVSRGWTAEALPRERSFPRGVRSLLGSRKPVAGCIVECADDCDTLPPRLFGSVPAVYLHPPPDLRGGAVRFVATDNAAVAREAFRELSGSRPAAFGVVGVVEGFSWSRERERAFSELAAAAGFPCLAFDSRREPTERRAARLAAWVAALPQRTAVFGTNDFCARDVAGAARAAARSIPRGLTLLGVDNDPDLCDVAAPSISSIQIDHERAGFLAARTLEKPPGTMAVFNPLMTMRRDSSRGPGRREPFVMEAVGIIRREACNGISVADVAKRVGVSPQLFALRFREAMGHSAMDELQTVRLETACAILSRTEVAIGAIAAMCGYGSDIALKVAFKKRTGMSMREWRARSRP